MALLERFRTKINKNTLAGILEAKDLDELNERSLGRVFHHVQAAGHKSFMIGTYYKSNESPERNEAHRAAFMSYLKSQKLGFIPMVGHGQERDEKTGKIHVSSEPSFMIPGAGLHHAKHIMAMHNQTGVIYSGPETQGHVHLHLDDGGHLDLGKFHPGRVAQFYSKVKGKPFTFEEDFTGGWVENMARFKFQKVRHGEFFEARG